MEFLSLLTESGLFTLWSPTFLMAGYLLILISRYRNEANDPQASLKLVLYFFLLMGLGFACDGVVKLLHYLLSGTKTGSAGIKQAIAGLVSGGLVVFVMKYLYLPRSNELAQPRLLRFLTGFVLAIAGIGAVTGLYTFLASLVQNNAWATTSGMMATTIVYGGLTYLALQRFGQMSGWREPPPRAVSIADTRDHHGYGAPPQQGYGGPTQGAAPPHDGNGGGWSGQ